jgi:hypothetical protein
VNTAPARRKVVIATAIAATAAPALLFLGSGSAQAVQDVSEGGPRDAISTLMAYKCPVPPPTPLTPCEQTPSLAWWPDVQPTAVASQGWLAP